MFSVSQIVLEDLAVFQRHIFEVLMVVVDHEKLVASRVHWSRGKIRLRVDGKLI